MEIALIIATLCAYFVKGLCGFANTLVFTTILSFRGANVTITPVDLLLSLPANLLMAYRERRDVRMRIWGPPALMVLAGSIPGIMFLKFGDVALIKLVLGVAVVAIGAEMLIRQHREAKQSSHPSVLAIIGLVSGFLCGLFGIGAPLAAYLGRTTTTAAEFRGNLSVVFLTNNLFRLAAYCATGIMTADIALTALKLVPAMLLGIYVGMHLAKRTDEARAQSIISAALIVSGVALFATNLP